MHSCIISIIFTLTCTHWVRHTSQEVPPEDGSSNKSASKTGDGQTYLELESTCVSHSNRFYVPHKEQGHVAVTPPDNCNNSTLDTQKETQEESYYELSC